jgi:phage tail sheath protein FI
MPITPTYPGVYVEEIPSGVRPITGVATSVAAFVDYFKQGPLNKAIHIFSMADFERRFGGLDLLSEASYAVQQFFLNGGTEAYVVRVASSDATNQLAKASAAINSTIGGSTALTVETISEGGWGNSVRVRVDPAPAAKEFNLVVTQYATVGSRTVVVTQETFRNLSMDETKTNFADKVVNDEGTGSRLVRVKAQGTEPPLLSGTSSGELTAPVTFTGPTTLGVKLDAGTAIPAALTFPTTGGQELAAIAAALEAAIRSAAPANPVFAGAAVQVAGKRLRILPGGSNPKSIFTFENSAGNEAATALSLAAALPSTVRVTISGELDPDPVIPATPTINVTIGAGGAKTIMPAFTGALPATRTLAAIAPALQDAIRAADAGNPLYAQARVFVVGKRLVALAGGDGTTDVSFAMGGANALADNLKLTVDAVTRGATLSGAIAGNPTIPDSPALNATYGAASGVVQLTFAGEILPKALPLATVAPALQNALQAAVAGNAAFNAATVAVLNDRLLIIPGGADLAATFTFARAGASQTAQTLVLTGTGGAANIGEYPLGGGAIASSAQSAGATGGDGKAPNGTDLAGSPAAKTGIYALDDADLFNILCLPRAGQTGAGGLTPDEALSVITQAQAYCEKRRAFFIMDTPAGIADPELIKQTADRWPKHQNAALYYPRLQIPDPLNEFRLRSVGASGTMAGLYARIDANRGVWKAPAGTEANLRNVSQLDDVLTDPENGMLNQLGINCLRTFPIFGSVAWGARTGLGSDQQASEWKYVPVRRMALFIEESLYRGLKWVVFEPNDEPLWSQIRLNVSAFMQNLFRQGAFQGLTPRDAYFVRCDRETTTQADINLGIVNILVGFAPLRPAEFVIIRLQQIAGQSAA